jgi:hypothetical protein
MNTIKAIFCLGLMLSGSVFADKFEDKFEGKVTYDITIDNQTRGNIILQGDTFDNRVKKVGWNTKNSVFSNSSLYNAPKIVLDGSSVYTLGKKTIYNRPLANKEENFVYVAYIDAGGYASLQILDTKNAPIGKVYIGTDEGSDDEDYFPIPWAKNVFNNISSQNKTFIQHQDSETWDTSWTGSIVQNPKYQILQKGGWEQNNTFKVKYIITWR